MGDKHGRTYESTSEDPYEAKQKRLLTLLRNPASHDLSNRKLGALAGVSEKMVRIYRRRLKLPSLEPHSGRSKVTGVPKRPAAKTQ